MKTYDQIVIDKLEEIQPATMKELSEALGYKTTQSCFYQMKNLMKQKKIIRDTTRKPYIYSVGEV